MKTNDGIEVVASNEGLTIGGAIPLTDSGGRTFAHAVPCDWPRPSTMADMAKSAGLSGRRLRRAVWATVYVDGWEGGSILVPACGRGFIAAATAAAHRQWRGIVAG
jgi:hypothetical protein